MEIVLLVQILSILILGILSYIVLKNKEKQKEEMELKVEVSKETSKNLEYIFNKYIDN